MTLEQALAKAANRERPRRARPVTPVTRGYPSEVTEKPPQKQHSNPGYPSNPANVTGEAANAEGATLLAGLQSLEAAANQAGCCEPLSTMAWEFREDLEPMGRGAWPVKALALAVETIGRADGWQFRGAYD